MTLFFSTMARTTSTFLSAGSVGGTLAIESGHAIHTHRAHVREASVMLDHIFRPSAHRSIADLRPDRNREGRRASVEVWATFGRLERHSRRSIRHHKTKDSSKYGQERRREQKLDRREPMGTESAWVSLEKNPLLIVLSAQTWMTDLLTE